MNKLTNGIRRLCKVLQRYNRIVNLILREIPEKSDFGAFGKGSTLGNPACISTPKNVFVGKKVRIQRGLSIINAPDEQVFLGDYSVLAPNVTIVTNSHRSTVGKTQFEISGTHENDKSADVIVAEDVWIGTNGTILAGVHIGRGAIVGAGAVVTKNVPPYSVVAGVPARIIAAVFNKEDILEHESLVYPQAGRMTGEEINKLFEENLNGLPVYGINTNKHGNN